LKLNLFKPLAHRPFALLWSGQTVSRLGDSLFRIALAWWVLEKTGSATAMATVLVFSSVPMLIFLLIGGVVTDRFPRLRIMLLSDLLSGLVLSVVTLLAFTGRLEVWHIYIASILFGFVEAFFTPAYTATIPEITPKELLPGANSLTSLSQPLTSVIGPALGASIIALGGTPTAFALDSLSFFISAACFIPILRFNSLLNQPISTSAAQSGLESGSVNPGLQTVFRDLGEGFKAVIASNWLWITIAIFAVINVTAFSPMAVSMPFLVKTNLHAGVGTLGLFSSVRAAGFVIGAIWLGSFSKIRRRGPFGYISTVFTGIIVAIFGLTTSIPVLVVIAFLGGLVISVFGLIWTNSLQELVPRELLGRVASIDALGSYVLLPIGYAIAGWGTNLVGAPLVFIIGGALTVLLALLGLSHPAIRNLD
jgi:DHA3 family tetracycline resistance protein-like MFS transporter